MTHTQGPLGPSSWGGRLVTGWPRTVQVPWSDQGPGGRWLGVGAACRMGAAGSTQVQPTESFPGGRPSGTGVPTEDCFCSFWPPEVTEGAAVAQFP